MRTHTSNYSVAGLFALMLLAGCASQTPMLDESFGDAVNAAKAQQTLNPDAALTNEPVYGIDGDAANAAIDTYRESYENPEEGTTDVFNIGVGTDSSTGTGN